MTTPARSLVSPRFEKSGTFEQVDYDNGIAYGFAIVCTVNNEPYFDLQDDHIPEDVMTKAAVEFFADCRVGKDQHAGDQVGDILFGMPMTKAIQTAEGITCKKTGLWIGYKPQDPVQLDMIARGERTGFSIGGYLLDGESVEIGKAVWSTAYQNELPDSSFLYVKAGGSKDASGKTTPRSNRMFPVKSKDGKVDHAHVSNALSRVDGASIPAEAKASVRAAATKLMPADKMLAKAAYGSDDKPKKKGRVFRSFKMAEISLVDRPAQEGATVSLVKSLASRDLSKEVVFTSSVDGHQHTICLDGIDGGDYCCTGYAESASDVTANAGGHSHRVIVEDGKLVIGDNAGHGHAVVTPEGWTPIVPTPIEGAPPGVTITPIAASAPRTGDLTPTPAPSSVPNMTDVELAALNARLANAEAQNARLSKLAGMTDAQKAYFNRLGSGAQDTLLTKSLVDIGGEVEKAIIWKAADGTAYYLNDDPRLVASAKKNDELQVSVAKAEDLRKDAEYVNKALAFAALPGDQTTLVAVVKALESITDEKIRKAAFEALAAGSAAMIELTKASGHQHLSQEVTDANGAFYKARDEFATKSNLPLGSEIEKAKATSAFLKTHEGAVLYKNLTQVTPHAVA